MELKISKTAVLIVIAITILLLAAASLLMIYFLAHAPEISVQNPFFSAITEKPIPPHRLLLKDLK
ncbi:MAG TPA: hypothetical protein VJ965_08730 [Anaerolineales bacterium]|nr:hypothetical protein [Anaerolineales bacterium]